MLARLDEQTAGQVTWRDLTALPCSHPHCCSVGYLLRDDAGTWRSLTSLIGHERLKAWLDLEPDLLANRIADDAIPASMQRGGQGVAARPAQRAVVAVAPVDGQRSGSDICENCDLGIGTLDDAGRLVAARSAASGCGGCWASGSCGSPSSRSWT